MELSDIQIEALSWWDAPDRGTTMPDYVFVCLFLSEFMTCEGYDCILNELGLQALEIVRKMEEEEEEQYVAECDADLEYLMYYNNYM